MAEIIIQFHNLGFSHFSEDVIITNNSKEEFTPDDILALTHLEACKHLLSQHIQVEYNTSSDDGLIYAGLYQVGTFSVIKVKQLNLWVKR